MRSSATMRLSPARRRKSHHREGRTAVLLEHETLSGCTAAGAISEDSPLS